MNKIGVIIVSYNSAADLKACLDSVKLQDNSKFSTISVVVDNNSSDNSINVAKKLGAKAIPNNKNLGFSKAVNIGIKEAYANNCDMILVLNPDAVLMDASIEAMLETFNNPVNTNMGAVGPMMVHEDGSSANDGYYLKAPSILTVGLFSTLLRKRALKNRFLVSKYEEQLHDKEVEVEQIPGACLLTSKDNLEKIGLLDEDFAIWFEDVEWSFRARKKGYKLYFCPLANVVHEGGVSFSKWIGLEKSVTFYVSMKTFFRKHKPFSYPIVVLILCINAFLSYIKSKDKNHLRFIKRFITQKTGSLPE